MVRRGPSASAGVRAASHPVSHTGGPSVACGPALAFSPAEQMLADGSRERGDRASGIVIGLLELVIGIVPSEPKLRDRRSHTSALAFKYRCPWQCPKST